MEHDDCVLEFALHEVLARITPASGPVIEFDDLRAAWRMTALRHSDLRPAIDLLVEGGSLRRRSDTVVVLTPAGASRAAEVASPGATTLADQVVRSVLKTIRDRVAPTSLQPRAFAARRRFGSARDRAVPLLHQRAG